MSSKFVNESKDYKLIDFSPTRAIDTYQKWYTENAIEFSISCSLFWPIRDLMNFPLLLNPKGG